MQLVLLTSERTLLPVVVQAREARTLAERFPLALARVLAALQVPPAAIEREVAAMAGPRIGKTASRQVLGTMNDFQRMMPYHAGRRPRSPPSPCSWPRPRAVPSRCGARMT